MKKLSLLMAVILVSFGAHALTLKEKKQVEKWKQQLSEEGGDGYAKLMKRNCGYIAPVEFEDKMVTSFMEKNTSLSAYCDAPRGTISHMCTDATSKKEIVAKVKKFTCKLGEDGKVDFKLNGGEVVMTVGVGASNLDEKARDFFENNL